MNYLTSNRCVNNTLSLILLSFVNFFFFFFLDPRTEKHKRKLALIYLEKSTEQLPLLLPMDAVFNTVT